MMALAEREDVSTAEIITRRFDDRRLGSIHAEPEEWVGPKLVIRRIDSGNPQYLSKEALCADRAGFTRALITELSQRERLPDLIHAHFADAADVASKVEEILGIPFIYTAHSLGMDKRAALGAPPSPTIRARIAEEDAHKTRPSTIADGLSYSFIHFPIRPGHPFRMETRALHCSQTAA